LLSSGKSKEYRTLAQGKLNKRKLKVSLLIEKSSKIKDSLSLNECSHGKINSKRLWDINQLIALGEIPDCKIRTEGKGE
jgi:hypothetical protein